MCEKSGFCDHLCVNTLLCVTADGRGARAEFGERISGKAGTLGATGAIIIHMWPRVSVLVSVGGLVCEPRDISDTVLCGDER